MSINKDYIAIYAAMLSTVLAFIKGWELYRDRFYLDVELYQLEEDTIYVFNPSKVNVQIKHWQLFWGKKGFLGVKKVSDIEVGEGYWVYQLDLPANSKQKIQFEEQYAPNLNKSSIGEILYIEFTISGRSKKLVIPVRR